MPDYSGKKGRQGTPRSSERGAVRSQLSQLCASYDRTAVMGAFPHDVAPPVLNMRSRGDLYTTAGDSAADSQLRDQAIWTLVYSEDPQYRSRDLGEMLHAVATSAREPSLRRSASWALFKIGEVELLGESLSDDDDGNVHSWKQHLIFESQGRTDWIDPRPMRSLDSELGYGVTLPLSIHGIVQFRTTDYTAPRGKGGLYGATSASATGGASSQGMHQWHTAVAGLIHQRQLVGELTASVSPESFYDNLIIQKRALGLGGQGRDHIQGYLFQGMSRSISSNAMAHYYASTTPQEYFLSGRIGDRSEGVVEVGTLLRRIAETNVVVVKGVDYPVVQSVRGLFYGPARMNPAYASSSDIEADGLLQIIKEPYANGWFFGEFRSVLVDVDGDGRVEVNGIEMFTDLSGRVVEQTPNETQLTYER